MASPIRSELGDDALESLANIRLKWLSVCIHTLDSPVRISPVKLLRRDFSLVHHNATVDIYVEYIIFPVCLVGLQVKWFCQAYTVDLTHSRGLRSDLSAFH